MKVEGLRCEALCNPIGVDFRAPRLTWRMQSGRRHTMQTAYRVIVSTQEASIAARQGDVFDSGRVESAQNACQVAGVAFASATRYFWSVCVWDNHGEEAWADSVAWWETGLLRPEDWEGAYFIEPPQRAQFATQQMVKDFRVYEELPDTERCVPCQLMRREFLLQKPVKKARAYATAHGLYRLEINGQRVGDLELTPEPTCYDKYLQYQTYDVTGMLQEGPNAVGLHIAPGWWSGIIGLYSASCQYGDKISALLKLVITFTDGTSMEICSDGSFVSAQSPYCYAEIYMGEKYDANLDQPGWSSPGFHAAGWKEVTCLPGGKDVLRGQNAEPIRVRETYPHKCVLKTPKGDTIIDFGQVTSGKAHIAFSGAPGTAVTFHYTQQLNEHGEYSLNITGNYNQATDTFVLGPEGKGIHEPLFVYHGFRYVMVRGDVQLDEENIWALSMSSNVAQAGTFRCSDARVNRLQENIRWSFFGNFIGIPTDNPDRERAGWTGDAQMVVETACYNLGIEAFWRRWLAMMRLEQRADGKIPFIVPNWRSYDESDERRGKNTAAGWGDACIIVPWMHYQRYGDVRILEENYAMMEKWMEYAAGQAALNPPDIGELAPERAEHLKYIWNTGWQYGDWLTPSDCTDENGNFRYLPRKWPLKYFTPSCFYVYSADLMAKIAGLLHKPEDVQRYRQLAQKIREACHAELFDENGMPKEDRQGAQVFALFFHIAPEGCEEKILNHLLELMRENGGRMDTGFSSTQYLPDVLTSHGHVRQAYDCLFNTQPPSWLYEVERGATGIWEGWQAVMPDGSVNPVSFLQCANGVIGNWLFSTVAGIRPDAPGFSAIRICPELDERLSSAQASYDCTYGRIESAWQIKDGMMTLRVSIPANTTAVVSLPEAVGKPVTENGVPLEGAEGVLGVQAAGERLEVRVGSGDYRFVYPLAAQAKA